VGIRSGIIPENDLTPPARDVLLSVQATRQRDAARHPRKEVVTIMRTVDKGPDYPVIVSCVGGYPSSDNEACFEISLCGVSYQCRSLAERDGYVSRLKYADRVAGRAWKQWCESDGRGFSVASAGYAGRPEQGYLASYAESEQIVDSDDFSVRSVFRYAVGCYGRLSLADWIGGWAGPDGVYLDVSKHFADRDECIAFAKANDQLAFYDCAKDYSFDL
jgi:hypothetical protein